MLCSSFNKIDELSNFIMVHQVMPFRSKNDSSEHLVLRWYGIKNIYNGVIKHETKNTSFQ